MIVSLVTPYARTNWHTRAVGQTLHVTDGLGLVVTPLHNHPDATRRHRLHPARRGAAQRRHGGQLS